MTHMIDRSTSRILVVDDDPDVVSVVKEYLEAQSGATTQYVVQTASDGLEALAVIRGDTRPDLVITDVMMPGMTGIELLRTMSKLCLKVPVIALTGNADNTVAAELMAAGAAAYMPKPVMFGYLRHLVPTLLKIPEARHETN